MIIIKETFFSTLFDFLEEGVNFLRMIILYWININESVHVDCCFPIYEIFISEFSFPQTHALN